MEVNSVKLSCGSCWAFEKASRRLSAVEKTGLAAAACGGEGETREVCFVIVPRGDVMVIVIDRGGRSMRICSEGRQFLGEGEIR